MLVGEDEWADSIKVCLRTSGLEQLGPLTSWEHVVGLCRDTAVHLLLVDAKRDGSGLTMVASLSKSIPHIPILLTLHAPDFQLARQARWLGAADVLALPDEWSCLSDLARKIIHPRREDAPKGCLIIVCSPKGGGGASVVATSIALSMAYTGRDALLLDLNLPFGGVDGLLALKPSRSILDLAAMGSELEDRFLEELVTFHTPSGLTVITAPTNATPITRLGGREAQTILAACQRCWSFVIVDAPGNQIELLAEIGSRADEILLVVEAEALAIRAALLLKQSKLFPDQLLGLVVNRFLQSSVMCSREISEYLRIPLLAEVPADPMIAKRVALGEPPIQPLAQRKSVGEMALIALSCRLSTLGVPKRGIYKA